MEAAVNPQGSWPHCGEKSVSCSRILQDSAMDVTASRTIHHQQCPVCGQTALQSHLTVADHAQSRETFELVRCPACHLVLTQDAPDSACIGPYYDFPEYVSHTDTQQGLFFRLYHWIRSYMVGRKAKWIQRWARTPGKLLDYGCGTGFFLHHMVQEGWQGIGLEVNENARKYAHDKWQLEVFAPERLADFRENFDVISLWHVLEHVHTLKLTVAQLVKALKPGGILVVAVPNYTSYDARYYGKDWAAYDVPRHLWHFAPKSMEKLMSGLVAVTKRSMPFDAYYVSLLSEKYRHASGLGRLRGLLVATIANIKAIFNPTKSSSVIYVFQKPLV